MRFMYRHCRPAPNSRLGNSAPRRQRPAGRRHQGSRLSRQPPTQRHSAFAAHCHHGQHRRTATCSPCSNATSMSSRVPDRHLTRRTLARSSCRSRLEQHQAVTNSPRTQRDPTPLSTCEPCFRRGGLNDEHCCVPVPCIQQSHVRWLTGSNGACCASPRRRERQGSTGLVEYGCLESFQALGDPRWRVVVGVMLLD